MQMILEYQWAPVTGRIENASVQLSNKNAELANGETNGWRHQIEPRLDAPPLRSNRIGAAMH